MGHNPWAIKFDAICSNVHYIVFVDHIGLSKFIMAPHRTKNNDKMECQHKNISFKINKILNTLT